MLRLINGKPDDGVRKDILGHPPLPSDMLVPQTTLGSDNKEGTNLFDVVESFEVTVRTVKHVERAWLVWDGIHPVDVVKLRLRNEEDRWNLCLKIKQSMDLYPSFLPPEVSPFINTEA